MVQVEVRELVCHGEATIALKQIRVDEDEAPTCTRQETALEWALGTATQTPSPASAQPRIDRGDR